MSRRSKLLNQPSKRAKTSEDQGCGIIGESKTKQFSLFKNPANAAARTKNTPSAAGQRQADNCSEDIRKLFQKAKEQKEHDVLNRTALSNKRSFPTGSNFKKASGPAPLPKQEFSEKFAVKGSINRTIGNKYWRPNQGANNYEKNYHYMSNGSSIKDYYAVSRKAKNLNKKAKENHKKDKLSSMPFSGPKSYFKNPKIPLPKARNERKRDKKSYSKGATGISTKIYDSNNSESNSSSGSSGSSSSGNSNSDTDQEAEPEEKKDLENFLNKIKQAKAKAEKEKAKAEREKKEKRRLLKKQMERNKLDKEHYKEEKIKKDQERRAMLYKNMKPKQDAKLESDLQNMENLFNKDFKNLEQLVTTQKTDQTNHEPMGSDQKSGPISIDEVVRREKEQQDRKIRYERRKDDGPFLKKILDLKLFKKPSKVMDSEIPAKFENYLEYYKIWEPLFEYEVYSQLINMKKEGAKSKIAETCFTASLGNYSIQGMLKSPDRLFFSLLMCAPANELKKWENGVPQKLDTRKYAKKGKFSNTSEWNKIFNQIRENDLIYLSKTKLTKKEERFNVTRMKPKEMYQFFSPESGRVLGIVNKRVKKSYQCIEVKFSYDIKDPLTSLCKRMQDDKLDFHVYYITNLSTVIREYLALKCIEFSQFVGAILDPCKYKEILSKRMKLREINNKKYNKSQNEALRYVASMTDGGLSLIQGPPGTGKTHTIHGILNMFVETKVEPNFKVLVCTPSNAACDEIVMRLGNEIQKKKKFLYRMVRIGAFDYEPPKIVKKYTLDDMVKSQLTKTGRKVDFTEIDKKCKEVDKISREMDKVEKNLKDCLEEFKEPLRQKYEKMKLQKGKLLSETNLLRQQKTQTKFNASSIEENIIKHANFIFTTLSMAGVDLIDKMNFQFSHLIIDEASQATEISALIPFCHDVKKIILVGDQNQLPATVFSDNAKKTLFNRSLYERFLANNIECFTLNIQYRMYHLIREFPNNQFYDGKITDDPSISKRFVDDKRGAIPRLFFYDLEYTECDGGVSKSNIKEAEFVANLFIDRLMQIGNDDFSRGFEEIKGKVGIITPYKKQSVVIKKCITQALLKRCSESEDFKLRNPYFMQGDRNEIDKIVQVSTVDSFQGKEKDTIIISLVRVSKTPGASIGFLHDFRRMNVALTRAKNFLWVVGHASTLNSNKNWGDFIRFCFKNKSAKTIERDPNTSQIKNINGKILKLNPPASKVHGEMPIKEPCKPNFDDKNEIVDALAALIISDLEPNHAVEPEKLEELDLEEGEVPDTAR